MNSLIWKRRIATFYPAFSQAHTQRKIILLYHAVGNGPWAITTEKFKEQMRWLKQNTQVLSLNDLLKSKAQKNTIQVALTFDDGYACLYDTVFPILQAENMTATVYINTGWISDSQKTRKQSNPDLDHYPGEAFLIWDEVRILYEHHWEIGSHGVEHWDLTKKNNAEIKNELSISKMMIETRLNKQCEHFAYTFGNHSEMVRKSVSDAEYRYAVAGHHFPIKKNVNPVCIPRLNIEKNYSLVDFKNIVLGKWDFLGYIQKVKKWIKN